MTENYCKYSDASRILFSPSVSPKKPIRKAPAPPPNAKKPPPLPSNPKPLSSSESKPPVAPRKNRPKDLQLTSFSSAETPSVPSYRRSTPSPGSPRLKAKQTVDIDHKKIHDHSKISPQTQHHRNRSEDISKFSESGKRHKSPMFAKQVSSLDRQESPRTPPSRSKSEGNLFEDDDAIDIENIVREPPIKSAGKKKTRFGNCLVSLSIKTIDFVKDFQ